MSIYKKLQQARTHIKELDLKKQGFNTFSKYNYYTPEQINYLVNESCNKVGLMHKFDLVRNEYGMQGVLTIIDLESKSSGDMIPEIEFKQATDIPQIKATNITQQIGGAVTYTQRYLLMTAFDIVDNNLDFDADQKKEESKKLPVLTKDKYADAIKAYSNGTTFEQMRKKYTISERLENELKQKAHEAV